MHLKLSSSNELRQTHMYTICNTYSMACYFQRSTIHPITMFESYFHLFFCFIHLLSFERIRYDRGSFRLISALGCAECWHFSILVKSCDLSLYDDETKSRMQSQCKRIGRIDIIEHDPPSISQTIKKIREEDWAKFTSAFFIARNLCKEPHTCHRMPSNFNDYIER